MSPRSASPARSASCVIAHRFGHALVQGGLGAAALNAVPVLGHGCDNPLRQRIGPDHVDPSSHVGNPLGDSRGPRGRSWELRDLTRADAAAVDRHVVWR